MTKVKVMVLIVLAFIPPAESQSVSTENATPQNIVEAPSAPAGETADKAAETEQPAKEVVPKTPPSEPVRPPQELSSIPSSAQPPAASAATIGDIVAVLAALVLLATNPPKKVAALVFLVLGTPAWFLAYAWLGLRTTPDGEVLPVWETYANAFSIIWLLFFAVDFWRNRNRSKPKARKRGRYVQAEWGVPHGRFEETEDGFFTVALFNGAGLSGGTLLFFFNIVVSGILYLIYGRSTGLLVIFTAVSALAYFCAKRAPTRITVTDDAIIIDGSRLKKDDFETFTLWDSRRNWNRLGVQYGVRNFAFGGEWPDWKAKEIASALNTHVRLKRSRASSASVPPAASRDERRGQRRPDKY